MWSPAYVIGYRTVTSGCQLWAVQTQHVSCVFFRYPMWPQPPQQLKLTPNEWLNWDFSVNPPLVPRYCAHMLNARIRAIKLVLLPRWVLWLFVAFWELPDVQVHVSQLKSVQPWLARNRFTQTVLLFLQLPNPFGSKSSVFFTVGCNTFFWSSVNNSFGKSAEWKTHENQHKGSKS